MDNKTDSLPHQLLIECEILLQDIAEKYPETLEDILNYLKDLDCRWQFIRDIQNGVPCSEEKLNATIERLKTYE